MDWLVDIDGGSGRATGGWLSNKGSKKISGHGGNLELSPPPPKPNYSFCCFVPEIFFEFLTQFCLKCAQSGSLAAKSYSSCGSSCTKDLAKNLAKPPKRCHPTRVVSLDIIQRCSCSSGILQTGDRGNLQTRTQHCTPST